MHKEINAMPATFAPARIFPPAFILLSLAVYWPTRDAGFVMDWLGWQMAYDRDGWAGVPDSFGYPGLHPVLHLGNYTLYWLFGANSAAWYWIFAALHGLNAWQLCRLGLRLPLGLSQGQMLFISAGAALLFLLSPYAAEVVVWRVCLHYLLALLFALLAMHATLDYLEGSSQRWWLVHLYVLLALFTFEWSLVIPLLVLTLAGVYIFSKNTNQPPSKLPDYRTGWQTANFKLILPMAALWAVYFLINKIRLGDWVGHYGADTHLNFSPAPMLANMLRYTLKQFAFLRHWEHGLKTQVAEGLGQGWPLWLGAGLLIAVFGAWLSFFRRSSARMRWAGAAFAWFFIALLPVSNLFFYYLQFSENDRYGYFASGFGWLGLLLLLSFLPKIGRRLVVLVLVGLSLCLLNRINYYWAESERLCDSLVDDFRWYDRDEVIILTSPDNYRGVFMFRIIGQINGFNEALELRRRRPFPGKMWEAAQYNITEPDNSFRVERDSAGLLHKLVFLQDGGNWWWRNGVGATDYALDRYDFRTGEWHAEVKLREKRPNTAIIFPSGGHWIEVK